MFYITHEVILQLLFYKLYATYFLHVSVLYIKVFLFSHAAFFVNSSVIKLMELFIVSIITTIKCVLLYLQLDYFSQVQPSFMCGTRDEQDFSLLVQCHLWSSQFSFYLCNLFLLVGFLYFNVTTSL